MNFDWSAVFAHVKANWRTSVQGILGGYLAIFSALTGADISGIGKFHYAPYFLASGAVAKAVLGFLQSDAKPKLPTP